MYVGAATNQGIQFLMSILVFQTVHFSTMLLSLIAVTFINYKACLIKILNMDDKG